MKRIGMLTFHCAKNYGAVLQTYALYKTLNSFSDCNAEVINYVPRGYRYQVDSRVISLEKEAQKVKKFENFLIEHCGVRGPIIHTVEGNEYDYYCVGSDQVWNTNLREVKTDYEYFLPHLDDSAVRIAYAASIGMKLEKINRELFSRYLPKFQSISLREVANVEEISRISGKNCQHVLDPTLLLKREDYDALIINRDKPKQDYVLYFWYGQTDGGMRGIELVNALARKYNLSIIHTFLWDQAPVRRIMVQDGGSMFYGGVEDFLWYIKHASAVVTNSFHGSIFSILYEHPLYIYLRKKNFGRLEGLTELLGLEDRVIHRYMSPDKLNLDIDYTEAAKILEERKRSSLDYLRNALELN